MAHTTVMKRVFPKERWLRFLLVSGCILLPTAVVAKTSLQARYPYDPACPWGRLSNGKGMIHRCLSEEEATNVARGAETADKKPTSAAGSVSAEAGNGQNVPPEHKSGETKNDPLPKEVQLALGPIEATEGEITIGRLDKPMDRYKECVMKNGGLSSKEGTVVVKFLVRAEAERAEGASVDSFKGVSEKAARCVADVVDRRQVGSPTAAVTGAKLHFKFSR